MSDLPHDAKGVSNDSVWLRREFIYESGAIISSLGVSLAEAAWRGSDVTVEATLRQIIAVVKSTTATTKELLALSNVGGGK